MIEPNGPSNKVQAKFTITITNRDKNEGWRVNTLDRFYEAIPLL